MIDNKKAMESSNTPHDERAQIYVEMQAMKQNLDANTALTQLLVDKIEAMQTSHEDMKASHEAGREDTSELLDIFRAARGAVKMLTWLGNVAKWVAMLSAACIGLYLTIKGAGTGPHQ